MDTNHSSAYSALVNSQRITEELVDYMLLREEIQLAEFAIDYKEELPTVRRIASSMVRRGEAVKERRGREVFYRLVNQEAASYDREEAVYHAMVEVIARTGRGAPLPYIVQACGLSSDLVLKSLAKLERRHRIERVPSVNRSLKTKYAYVPMDKEKERKMIAEQWREKNGNIRFNFLTPGEIAAAKRKIRVGDVLLAKPTIMEGGDVIQHNAVVACKSRHLIVCTSGETYSYADVARYYRDKGKTPIGRWET